MAPTRCSGRGFSFRPLSAKNSPEPHGHIVCSCPPPCQGYLKPQTASPWMSALPGKSEPGQSWIVDFKALLARCAAEFVIKNNKREKTAGQVWGAARPWANFTGSHNIQLGKDLQHHRAQAGIDPQTMKCHLPTGAGWWYLHFQPG